MYLKLQESILKTEMENINKTILHIFKCIADHRHPDINILKASLGTDESWVITYYHSQKSMRNAVEKLLEEPQHVRRQMYDILKHDMEFEKHAADKDFEFLEKELSVSQRNEIKSLMKHIYQNIFQRNKMPLSFENYRDSLYKKNKNNICPACLGYERNLQRYGEIDHYFPKNKYPALILHPVNLAGICRECNSLKVKGNKDPLRNANLAEIYIPYLRAAEEETRICVTGRGGERVLGLRPVSGQKQVEERIKNFDVLFDLSSRWTMQMYNKIKEEFLLTEHCMNEAEVEAELVKIAGEERRKAVALKQYALDAACSEFLITEGKHAFMEEWKKRREEKEKMRSK